MRVAMFEGVGQPLRVTTVPDPSPGDEQVVVRVGRCGICSSDLHMTEGHDFTLPPGAVPGHEFSGEIVALGKGAQGLTVGDRVTVLPALTCGHCRFCLAGAPFACEAGSRTLGVGPTWGGYAEYAIAGSRWCLPLPDELSLEDGALMEPLAVGLHGVRLAGIRPGDRVLVIGAGPVGLAAIYWARRLGAGRIAVTASSTRRAALAETMGADAFLVPEPGRSLAEASADALGGQADVVLECAGVPGTIDQGIDCVRRSGTVAVLGICTGPETIGALRAVLREVTLRFAFAFDRQDFEFSIDALLRGSGEPRRMVSGTVGLGETPSTFETLRTDKAPCKVMIDPSA
jgi:threonine dehydrogenase-like Zn-dependent dehydrogenase